MRILALTWHYGLPLLVVVAGLGALRSAIWGKPRDFPLSGRDWPLLAMVLVLAGDATLGDNRPAFEREWKGMAAGLFVLSVVIVLCRRHRRSLEARTTEMDPNNPQPR